MPIIICSLYADGLEVEPLNMSEKHTTESKSDVQERLISAAFELFLHNDYHKVTTRQLAKQANTSLSMIQYYFGDKQNLYEEMMRQQFKAIRLVLENAYSEEQGLDFIKLMLGYLAIHESNPELPAFITKIMTSKTGPGYRLLSKILNNKKDLIEKIVRDCQKNNLMTKEIDTDILRIAMMAMSVFPFLIQEALFHNANMTIKNELMKKIALFSGQIFNIHTQPNSSEIWKNLKNNNE